MQFKHLQRSLISLFSTVILLVGMFVFSSGNVFSQSPCPDGFIGPFTTIVNLCAAGCPMEVEWCCKSGINPTAAPSVHINNIRFLVSPTSQECMCLQMVQHPNYEHPVPLIPLNPILTGIFNSGIGCFPSFPSSIPPCDEDSTLQTQVTFGGCYRWDNSYEHWGYFLCQYQPPVTLCHQYFSICVEYINGEFVVRTRADTPPLPQFGCQDDCHPLCSLVQY